MNSEKAKYMSELGRENRLKWCNSVAAKESLKKSNKIRSEMIKSGLINPSTFLGNKHTEETKNKMRKSKNVGIDNSQYGTYWITNGIQNKKLKKSDFIPIGWYKGRNFIW